MTSAKKLTCILARRLAKAGLSLDLFNDAREIVVFGSYATGVNNPESDLDVLAIGCQRRIKRSGLDVIPLSVDYVQTLDWLESELASHVATYGVWLRGQGEWKACSALSARAFLAKSHRVKRLLHAVLKAWNDLPPTLRTCYRQNIRRELQRLQLLRCKVAVPPSAALDALWLRDHSTRSNLLRTARSLKVNKRCFRFVQNEIVRPEERQLRAHCDADKQLLE
jgi:predicted nucleotidyltransferase